VDIVATDDFSWEFTEKYKGLVFHVLKEDRLEAIQNIEADILIISWPHFDDERITEICDVWGNEKPVIYIGEGSWGCCAHESFFSRFETIEHPAFSMPSWEAIHDYVMIGKFKDEEKNYEKD
jgi:hypothetical protein